MAKISAYGDREVKRYKLADGGAYIATMHRVLYRRPGGGITLVMSAKDLHKLGKLPSEVAKFLAARHNANAGSVRA